MSKKEQTASLKKRRLKREQKYRREAIITTAEKIFLDQGYDATFVDQIAVAAGYTKATIYNYFESKDDLFVAVISKAYEKIVQTFEKVLKQPGAQRELRVLGDAYVSFVYEYPEYAGLVDSGRAGLAISSIIQKEEANQALTESEQEFRQYQLQIRALLENAISETMKTTGVQTDVEPFSVVMVLSTLGLAIRELALRGKRNNWPEEQSRNYLDVLLNIIDKGLKHYAD